MKDYTTEVFRDRELPEELPIDDVCRLLCKVTDVAKRLEVHDENDAFMRQRLFGAVDDFRVAIGLSTLNEQDDLDGLND